MKEQWIAVARGLKCCSASTRISYLALAVAVVACVWEVFASSVLDKKGRLEWILWVALVLILLGFAISIASRTLLSKIPSSVKNGQFLALGSMALEIASLANLGGILSTLYFRFIIPQPYSGVWLGLALLAGIVGRVMFLWLIRMLVGFTDNIDVEEDWSKVAALWITTLFVVPIAIFIACLVGKLIVAPIVFLLLAMVLLAQSFVIHLRLLRRLRYSFLREAVRCGE